MSETSRLHQSTAVELDSETHIYRAEGRIVPGVTEILKSAGLIDGTWFTEASAWRGSVIHMACQLDDEGDLDELSVAEEAKGPLEAWRKCRQEMRWDLFDIIEQPLIAHTIYGSFAGKPDRLFSDTVIDLKSGTVAPATAIQTAAYAHLSPYQQSCDRVAVRLQPNGKYSLKQFHVRELRADQNIFWACLGIHNWKARTSR